MESVSKDWFLVVYDDCEDITQAKGHQCNGNGNVHSGKCLEKGKKCENIKEDYHKQAQTVQAKLLDHQNRCLLNTIRMHNHNLNKHESMNFMSESYDFCHFLTSFLFCWK